MSTEPSGFAASVDRAALLAEARAWVADCAWREDPDEIAEYSDQEIIRGVDRHYDGGIDGLARAALLELAPRSPLVRTHGWDGQPLTAADKRFFDLRDSGYRGWIDQDGHALTDDEHERRMQDVRTCSDMSTARFDPPPAAKPYTPSPTSTGVTVNSTIQEIRGTLTACTDVITAAQGPIQQAIDEATRARNALMGAMDGSHQPDVEGQVATLTNMIEHLEDALGRSHQAITGNQQIGDRL